MSASKNTTGTFHYGWEVQLQELTEREFISFILSGGNIKV